MRTPMESSQVAKVIVVCTGLVCLTVLMAIERVSETAGVPLLGLFVGYVVGNGVLLSKGRDKGGDPV